MMLTDDERDWLRLASLVLGKPVGELRNMILNGYLIDRKLGREYTGTLGSSEVKPSAITELTHLNGPAIEDSVDILSSLWLLEMRIQVLDEKTQRAWEEHYTQDTDEPADWWP